MDHRPMPCNSRRPRQLKKKYAASTITMQRIVSLSGGRTISLKNYTKAWKLALAAPADAVFDKGFNWYSETRAEVLREFRRGLHHRINRRIDGFPGTLRPTTTRGRKLSTMKKL